MFEELLFTFSHVKLMDLAWTLDSDDDTDGEGVRIHNESSSNELD